MYLACRADKNNERSEAMFWEIAGVQADHLSSKRCVASTIAMTHD